MKLKMFIENKPKLTLQITQLTELTEIYVRNVIKDLITYKYTLNFKWNNTTGKYIRSTLNVLSIKTV